MVLNVLSYLSKIAGYISSSPWVYDKIQMIVGSAQIAQWLAPYISPLEKKLILDIGAGTGLYRSLVSNESNYIWTDVDPQKLNGFAQRRRNEDFVLLSDGTRLCFDQRSIDVALCLLLTHHLSNQELDSLFNELDRVVKDRIIVLDALYVPTSNISRLLWALDRGSYPKSAANLQGAIQSNFIIEHIEYYHVYHHYLLCVARPQN